MSFKTGPEAQGSHAGMCCCCSEIGRRSRTGSLPKAALLQKRTDIFLLASSCSHLTRSSGWHQSNTSPVCIPGHRDQKVAGKLIVWPTYKCLSSACLWPGVVSTQASAPMRQPQPHVHFPSHSQLSLGALLPLMEQPLLDFRHLLHEKYCCASKFLLCSRSQRLRHCNSPSVWFSSLTNFHQEARPSQQDLLVRVRWLLILILVQLCVEDCTSLQR